MPAAFLFSLHLEGLQHLGTLYMASSPDTPAAAITDRGGVAPSGQIGQDVVTRVGRAEGNSPLLQLFLHRPKLLSHAPFPSPVLW